MPSIKSKRDPLHFSPDELTVKYKKKSILLNKHLLDRQNAWGNLEKIKECHLRKLKTFHMMENTDDAAVLKVYDKIITKLEFKLQKLWGFEKDAKFHKFWDRPGCKCAVIDNEDAYPSGYYTVRADCPLHGQELTEEIISKFEPLDRGGHD